MNARESILQFKTEMARYLTTIAATLLMVISAALPGHALASDANKRTIVMDWGFIQASPRLRTSHL
jgi:hypothetical protein